MTHPAAHFVDCPGPAGRASPHHPEHTAPGTRPRRMCWWQWEPQDAGAGTHLIVCAHGLTRQGRDFDVLARHLRAQARVICPDVCGRGHSDWLLDAMQYHVLTYVADMRAMLWRIHERSPFSTLDWVGTSMGGLIGMLLAADDGALPVPIRRLVLNDIGPALEWPALQRIASYVGQNMHYADEHQAAAALRTIAAGFGPHSGPEWLALTRPMLRPDGQGVVLHYDPQIAVPMQGGTEAAAQAGTEKMWTQYARIRARTLVLRGMDSDLLSRENARAMTQRGPRAQLVEFAGVGHAPTFVAPGQAQLVHRFLYGTQDAPLPAMLDLAAQARGSGP